MPPNSEENKNRIMSVTSSLQAVRASLPEGVELVAVSKFHDASAIAEAYAAGQRIFGESRAAELAAKHDALPGDIQWHFIGHLQTNKAAQVVAVADVIQSIDSERLLAKVDREAARLGRRPVVLLQAHVAAEETKFGFSPEEMLALATPDLAGRYPNVVFGGLMGMASNTGDTARIADDFNRLRSLFETLRQRLGSGFATLSMGMSHDRDIAISCGSTMVRIGTDIFGPRQY